MKSFPNRKKNAGSSAKVWFSILFSQEDIGETIEGCLNGRVFIPVQYSCLLQLVPLEELDQLSLMPLQHQTLLYQNLSSQGVKHVVVSL
jgi:hypothetical protein